MSLKKQFIEVNISEYWGNKKSANSIPLYLDFSEREGITKHDFPIPLSEFDKHKDNQILPTDKNIYFTQTSTIPKYKIKEYYLNQGITNVDKTNRSYYGEVFVLNYAELKHLYEAKYNKYIAIPKKDAFKLVDEKTEFKEITTRHDYVFLNIDNNADSYRGIYNLKLLESYPSFIDLSKYQTILIKEVFYRDAKLRAMLSIYDHLVTNINTAKFVYDESILESLHAESIIDKDTYENFCSMMDGGDKEAKNLIMDILANSDPKQSKFYILVFLNEYWRQLKDKTANFNSMMDYFKEYKNIIRNDNWEIFCSKILQEGLTDEDYKIINTYIVKRLNTQFKQKGGPKIKQLILDY